MPRMFSISDALRGTDVWRFACIAGKAECRSLPGGLSMRRAVALLMVVLLAVLHAPSSAQALMSSLLQDLFPHATSEPAMLLLTGAALLCLARMGK
jgi:hypothetical protein